MFGELAGRGERILEVVVVNPGDVRELGGQPARLGEGSASLPAGMRERARRLGAASRSYRG